MNLFLSSDADEYIILLINSISMSRFDNFIKAIDKKEDWIEELCCCYFEKESNKEYYGFGLGSHGFIGNIRYENTKNLTKYINGDYKYKEDVLSQIDDMDNTIMLGFRLLKGINLQDFYDKYKVNLQEKYDISELVKNKELIYKDGYLFINPKYIYTMNEILIKII